MNDNQVNFKDMECNFMLAYNGKFGGGGIFLNCLGMINDGYFEIGFYNEI